MAKNRDKMNQEDERQIAIFRGKGIRRIIYQKEWWFSIVDVCEVLTGSPTPRQYWEKIKKREFADFQLSPIWGQLKLPDGNINNSVVPNLGITEFEGD